MPFQRPQTLAACLALVTLAGCGVAPSIPGQSSSQSGDLAALSAREQEPLTFVAPEYVLDTSYMGKLKAYADLARERAAAGAAPGLHLGLNATGRDSAQTTDNLRAKHPTEASIPVVGLKRSGERIVAQDIPNPDTPDGTWNPLQYAPNVHFDAREDSYPVAPGFDGDLTPSNNPASYRHGHIGAQQPVGMNFSVSRKGEFYVLQYSSYFVDNKVASGYHVNDSATVAVYLQANANGKLAPAYLYTSWHFGAILAPWAELQKDASGHPSVLVDRGSHAVRPLAPGKTIPADGGLVIRADGSIYKRGSAKPLSNKLVLNAVQPSVKGALQLAPDTTKDQFALQVYFGWYADRMNPYHPCLFIDNREQTGSEG